MKTRALVICGDAWHSAETVRRGLAPLRDTGFDFKFFEDRSTYSAKPLTDFASIVLAKANMISATDQRLWLTSDFATAFRNHLRLGSGLVVIHAGASRYEQSPGMREIIGGAFAHHPDRCEVTIEPQPGHPIADGVTKFTVRDEHYFMDMNDVNVDVFLHSRSEHGLQPAGWTQMVDSGRVCVLTPGHNLEVWLHPEFQKLLLNALRWTAKLN